MKNIKRPVFYALHIIIATGFFIYYLFPSETAKAFIKQHLCGTAADCDITIDRIKPAFPASLMFSNLQLYYLNNRLLTADEIKVTPKFSTLLRRKTTFFFKGQAYKGKIKGKIDMMEASAFRSVLVHTDLFDMQLMGVTAIQNISGQKISGLLNGQIAFNRTETAETINAFFQLSDLRVDLSTPILNLKTLRFRDVQTDIGINNQNLIIKRCIVKGVQIDGHISGSIAFRKDIGKSVLNLTGAIKPHHLFLSGIGKGLSSIFFPKSKRGEKSLFFGVSGTFGKPGFYLK
ncbi:MAG: type II secretion system protein GspN [Desulfobacterales bacterium]